jgi:hypothetical protein
MLVNMLESVITQSEGQFTAVHRNKNADSIFAATYTLLITRHTVVYSHTHPKTKRSALIGVIHRMIANTRPGNYARLWRPTWVFVAELRCLGYPMGFIDDIFWSMRASRHRVPEQHERELDAFFLCFYFTFREVRAALRSPPHGESDP